MNDDESRWRKHAARRIVGGAYFILSVFVFLANDGLFHFEFLSRPGAIFCVPAIWLIVYAFVGWVMDRA